MIVLSNCIELSVYIQYFPISRLVRIFLFHIIPKVEVSVMPSDRVFSGETVTLRCDFEEGVDWTYGWYKDDSVVPISTERVHKFISDESDAGKYTCRGEKKRDSRRSEISDAVTLTVSATITADPDQFVFTGETIALKCAIESHYSDWRFHWSKYSSMFAASEKNTSTETLTIESVSESDQDKYWCWGERESRPMKSQKSEAVSVNVAGECFTVCNTECLHTFNSENWLTEGDSVTLVCAVRSSSRGWTFSWYRDDHELSSESSKGAEGSYTLSPAAVKHTGVYACRAERGAYYTEYSYTQLLWVTREYLCPWSSSSWASLELVMIIHCWRA
uniref:Ig-like domain-containing protein n=1 Tax=Sinocyclocheilus grahami TaxID=75366 RepID=A0A672L0L3_SINGR